MFNFELLNKALTDVNVSETEFRTLYLIVNNCGMKNTDSIEMYNAFLMEKLHYSESTVKRCTKALEQNGYISIKRATKKKTPNIITLMPIKNESKEEAFHEGKNDTLYNNIDNNINNIQSNIQCNIQSNRNDIEDNGIDYDVFCEQELAKKKAKKALYNSSNLNDYNPNEIDNSDPEIHSNDTVNDYSNEIDNSNAEIHSNDTVNDYSNEDMIDKFYEVYQYQQGMSIAAEQCNLPQQQNKSKSIDWDKWRQWYEHAKKGMLNAKCKTEFDLNQNNCKEKLQFAKEHMRPENYEKISATYDKWYTASEPYFYYNKNKQHTPKQETPFKPTKDFNEIEWDNYIWHLNNVPDTRKDTAHNMVQYLKDCGEDPKNVIRELKEKYGIIVK